MTDLDAALASSDDTMPFGFIPTQWSPGRALWLLVLVFVLSILGSLAARYVIARHLPDTTASLLVGAVLVAGYLAELAVVRWVAAAHGLSFSASVGLVSPGGGSVLAWVTLAIVGALTARGFTALYVGVLQRLRIEPPGADASPLALFPGGGLSAIVLFMVVALIAPFAEEVVFRGVLLPAFGARWGAVLGVLISSVLFAALHVSAYVLVPIGFAAMVFGWLVVRFRSLWPAYVAHASFNGIAVVLLLALKARGLV